MPLSLNIYDKCGVPIDSWVKVTERLTAEKSYVFDIEQRITNFTQKSKKSNIILRICR